MPWVGGGCPGWVADALGGWWVPRVDARCPWHSQPPLQFAGTWHVAAAASNCSVFLRMKDGMKSPISTISITPGGDMAMTLILPLLDRCQKFELLLQQRGQPGHYMAVQEKRELHVLETDYGHYGIVQQLQHSGQGHSVGLQLLTRGQHVSPQLLQRFQELLPTVGLTKDMLAVLPKSVTKQMGKTPDCSCDATTTVPAATVPASPAAQPRGASLLPGWGSALGSPRLAPCRGARTAPPEGI
ncbi:lipocalin-15-like isoform X3 [Colius striatus]|uniref:lipocalin-15-like isoform X3 n=1 Tax=Colius striatus TaxID=57412 RepID=UPI002B1D1747|nr:lipocalin-15-like isoform X3 [Colius striatus]